MRKFFGLLVCSSFALMNTAQAEALAEVVPEAEAEAEVMVIAEAEAVGDIENGRALSTSCSACHGAYGISPSERFPNIAGQKESYLAAQLEKYQTGERSNPIMQAIVGPLNEQEILDLAAYYAVNSTIASYSFETSILAIPFVDADGTMYSVEMLSDSDFNFSLTNVEER